MGRIIESCVFSLATLEEALAMIDELTGLPRWGRLWLSHLATVGIEGAIEVDVSNVLSVILRQPASVEPGLSEEQLTPLRWWSWLVGGTVIADGTTARLVLEGYPPSDASVVGEAEKTVTESMASLSTFGYRLPFAVAIALSAQADKSRACLSRSVGRRGELMILELCAATEGAELSAVFDQLVRSAGPRCAFARVWNDREGWHYLEAFTELAPSENYSPPAPPPPEAL